MDDAAGSSMLDEASGRARHTLTVAQVAAQLADAGVARSERRIKYFCQTKVLDADKFPTPTGPQWYIDPASVPGLIGDLKQFDEQQRRRAQQAAAGSDALKPAPMADTAAAGSSRLQPAAAGIEDRRSDDPAGGVSQQAASGYVSQLEKRIEEKDRTIEFLQDELKDRRSQISGMKAIIDGQRQLLESINHNVAPIFQSLARLVAPKTNDEDDRETVRAAFVDAGVGNPQPETASPGV
jgi:hypothetical protein